MYRAMRCTRTSKLVVIHKMSESMQLLPSGDCWSTRGVFVSARGICGGYLILTVLFPCVCVCVQVTRVRHISSCSEGDDNVVID